MFTYHVSHYYTNSVVNLLMFIVIDIMISRLSFCAVPEPLLWMETAMALHFLRLFVVILFTFVELEIN